ncbi:NADH-quinone oxidoreductase subunit 5 family protein [Adlercreutzia murintestinalis]|uniref:NADH-quinone oxidoreductase subunit 5 family protein n=1 Tax=Adlercreutzia murintestinalis TaxID=2941325 RepID=UPI00203D2C1E|nr:proton-conducting transporter membrane subunit [Adlercreutzia murintestinalis]
MQLIATLILLPLIAAILLLIIRQNTARTIIVCAFGTLIALASVVFAGTYLAAGPVFFDFNHPLIDHACTAISGLCVVVILAFSAKYKNIWAALLAIIQIIVVMVVEFGFASQMEVEIGLYTDLLSIIMVLIIGIIGSGICIYALGYMEDFQAHQDAAARDRRPTFFALMFIFLSAMFAIVLSNNMSWMFTAWEVTTLCSFLLIGYTKTDEAIRNAFRQIIMNLAGGIAFIVALWFAITDVGTLSLIEFLQAGIANPAIVAVPITFLAFAGITKAAQMPFQTWLLGAMVAPTPTSALLHSSTMVKAGVFLLVKLAPLFLLNTIPSVMVMLVGGITFLLCSFMAISQTNAKRVLAYSTIANLGLITMCAGVGTPEAVWAAIFLIIFHAIAKSLLFLCVGTAEHHIGSRDIEDMDLLFERMPRLARFMMLGIMCMFIAPFGMLIAKWGALVSFANMDQIALILILAFGSAATFMFWAKWLGKLAGIAGQPPNVELSVHKSEWVSILLMVMLLVFACIALPAISAYLVEPYVVSAYQFAPVAFLVQDISFDNLYLASISVCIVVIALFCGLGRSKKRQVDVYLAGVSRDDDARAFQNSLSGQTVATARNWYMEDVFGEARIAPVGVVFNSVVMLCAVVLALVGITLA